MRAPAAHPALRPGPCKGLRWGHKRAHLAPFLPDGGGPRRSALWDRAFIAEAAAAAAANLASGRKALVGGYPAEPKASDKACVRQRLEEVVHPLCERPDAAFAGRTGSIAEGQ